MRSRILPAVGVSAVALVAATALASGASASGHHVTPFAKSATTKVKVHPHLSCYAQTDNDNGIGIVSQNFEATFDQYDAAAADDFKLASTCKITKVHAIGVYFNGSGPARDFTVTFYKGKSMPGGVIKSLTKPAASDNFGDVTIKLGRKGPKLAAGHYWVSVVANLDFSAGGEWGWNTNNTVRGKPAMWQNPGNGFGTGCTTWGVMTTCIPSGEGGDLAFELLGK